MSDDLVFEAVRRRITAFAAALRTVPDTAAAVPGLGWTAADLAQHVACLPSFWRSHHEAGAAFERPQDFGAYSDQARAHITSTDADELADLIEAEFDDFVTDLSDGPSQRWLYGRQVTPAVLLGMAVSEAVVHGRDLAGLLGAKPPAFERSEANAAIAGVMATAPVFVDESKALAQPDGVYHLRFKGGNDYTWTKSGAELTVTTGRPAKADAHMIADPAMFMLSSLGRVSQLRAGLSGKIISYGRKPWRFLGLGAIVVEGI